MLPDPTLPYTLLAPLPLQSLLENLPNSQLHPIELNCSYHVHLQAHFTPSTSYNYCFGLDETNCEGATTSIGLFLA